MVVIDGTEVGPIGYGLMSYTWTQTPMPLEEAVKVMKTAVERGVRFWNGSEFYGPPTRNSLHLIRKYFDTYPEDKGKIRFNIKGAVIHVPGAMHKPDPSEAGIFRSIKFCQEILGDIPLDMFEPSRLSREVGVEESLHALKKAYDEGLIRGVGLSEVSAETIEKAHAILGDALKTVELELNLCNMDFLQDRAIKLCGEYKIPLVAYAPLARGLLAGRITKVEDVSQFLQTWPRFQGENLVNNLKLANAVIDMARDKSTEDVVVTPAQVAIGWLLAMSGRDGNPDMLPIPSATTVKRVAENYTPVVLDEADLAKIQKIMIEYPVSGPRYREDLQYSLGV